MIPQHMAQIFKCGVSALALLAGAHAAATEDGKLPPSPAGYPRQTITLISPFPPGGGNDNIARLLATELGSQLGQTVIVDNKAGAGGNVGTALVARAKPDGYTLVLSQNSVMAINPVLYKNVGFSPLKDFTAISQITTAPLALVVPDASLYKTLDDYLEAAQKQPGRISYASPGNGTLSHLAGMLLAKRKNLTLMHVPYRGASPAVTDLLGGSVDMLITSPASVESLVSSKKLRVLAVTTPSKVGPFKEAPSLEKLGIKDMAIEGWYGLFAPSGTPRAHIAQLAAAIDRLRERPALAEKVRFDGAELVLSSPEAFRDKLQKEIAYWSAVVKATNLTID